MERGRKKKLYDINWATSKKCKCCEAEGTENTGFFQCKESREERNNMPDAARTYEMKARSSKEDWKWQRGLMSYPQFGEHWSCSEPRKQTWISDTSRSWVRREEGFRNHIASDGSLNQASGRDAACGWARKKEPWESIWDGFVLHVQDVPLSAFLSTWNRSSMHPCRTCARMGEPFWRGGEVHTTGTGPRTIEQVGCAFSSWSNRRASHFVHQECTFERICEQSGPSTFHEMSRW